MIPPEYIDQVTLGDCRELSQHIPDASIDMIFTDPLYHKKHLHYYGWLAETGVRVLKPGSWAFIYGGWVAKEVLNLLDIDGWDHHMTISLVNKAGYPRWWSKKVMVGYKPVYVFTKGKPKIFKWQSNLGMLDMIDKRYHKFGQGTRFPISKIDMFTQAGDIVFDPFCGGGQTAEACKVLDRHFVTFEIDPKTVETARLRVHEAQPPLTGFNHVVVQSELEI